VSDANGDDGQVIGVVVDDMDRPFLQKAVIRFPDLGKSYQSNEQGFFRTGALPQGNHKIEYTIDGNLIGVDYATIVGNEITTLVLKPNDVSESEPVASTGSKSASKPIAQAATSPPEPTQTETTSQKSKPTTSSKSSGKSSKARYAKLVLAANVEGAKLAIDGDVLGAGNLTYTKLSPGKHSYSVTKDGFDTKTGSITLKSNSTSKLEVALTPLTQAAKNQIYDADDFFHSGLNLLRDGKYKAAVADMSQSIEKEPSHAEAHFGRAQAYEMLKNKQSAYDDYLRAAEIFQFRKDFNQAVTSYNKAIELDKEAVAPYLGRANVYLSKGEQIAAIADFDAVIHRDKKNWQAHYGLGKARFEQGYYKKAVNHFKEARSINSENPEVYEYLMLSYMGANDIKNVKKSYEKFTEFANDQQKRQFQQDNRFTAVRRVIDMES
jgi:tetratricopeptide (TPR) repeat protein